MIDILEAGPTFEHRASAWSAAALGLDETYAAQVAEGLTGVAAALSAGQPHALKGALAAMALALREDARRGAAALAYPAAAYGGVTVHQGPGRQALYDALLLRAVGEGMCDLVADALEVRSWDEGVVDYGREVVATALLDVACAQVDPAGDFAQVDALLAVRRDVAASPRTVVERAVVTEVRESDTLQSLARRVYGSPDDWPRLAQDYSLAPPYLSTRARSGCLSPGMRLLRPDRPGDPLAPDGLGVSFRLDATTQDGAQEWDLVPSPAGGIEMAYGLDALAVDCAVRLATPLGDFGDRPEYGYPELPGLPATSANALAMMLASDTLIRDPRVADVVPALDASQSGRGGRVVGTVRVIPVG